LRKVLVTGMSGTGKSSALAELSRRGFEVVDTDESGWTELARDGGHVWREDRIDELLARDRDVTLFVSGTVSNQGGFYPWFDHLAEVEPLLRATCTHEIDASRPLEDVVAELMSIGADG
jgi:predicted ATPase